ncbi:MAG: hypothetical protein JO040_04480 [Gemmatimonadetes bacterium]|nr:hypothetical protein [Gemmatimonadota bacterium]
MAVARPLCAALALALAACGPREVEDATLQGTTDTRMRMQTLCVALDHMVRRDTTVWQDPELRVEVARADTVCDGVAREGDRAAELRKMRDSM